MALYNINVDELTGDRKVLLAEKRRRNAIGWVLGVARDRSKNSSCFRAERFALLGRFDSVASAVRLHYLE
jgi:hypothetical protein